MALLFRQQHQTERAAYRDTQRRRTSPRRQVVNDRQRPWVSECPCQHT